jgi:predicted lipoprotein with Yx(FWY)xxD motif
MRQPRRLGRFGLSLSTMAVLGAVALFMGCGGGTSSADKTATAMAEGGAPAATATQAPVATSTATPVATASATSMAGAAAPTVMIAQAGSLGQILTDDSGMTLYIYKDDVPYSGVSSVPASIAANWPAFVVTVAPVKPAGLTGDLSTMTLPDDSQQVTYNGMPLYYYIGDTKPGDTNGQGLQNRWFVATP